MNLKERKKIKDLIYAYEYEIQSLEHQISTMGHHNCTRHHCEGDFTRGKIRMIEEIILVLKCLVESENHNE